MEVNGGACSSFAFLCKLLVSVYEYKMLPWTCLKGQPFLNLLLESGLESNQSETCNVYLANFQLSASRKSVDLRNDFKHHTYEHLQRI